ncbi:peroxisomal leader peptide-processing protease isoform X2 [Plodia interpunctella]|nr:peroxisomal leader peptide-processing protease isoform X2 [Plodia interpunctella]XP_053614323.1 peroxisomal leader peptide-processing protease isoform X2 [Plodia interpunctella]
MPNVYEAVEKMSRERSLDSDTDFEHSSYQIRVLTGRICHVWQCPILDRCVDDILYSWTIGHRDGDVDKQSQLGKTLLSVFVLVDLDDDRGLKNLRPLSELFDMVRPAPQRGSTIEVHSTPFGCEVFLNAVTRGSICGVVGKKPSLLLTDASTALGSEGGPVYTEGPTKELVGVVVCSVSWWRGEWVGLTLAAPLRAVLAAKLRLSPPAHAAPVARHPYSDILERIDSSTVLVRCGGAWGAGVYLGVGFVLTCAHVVTNYTIYKVSVYCKGVKETAIVRYKTADDKAYDLALLYMNPQYWTHLRPAVMAKEPAVKGESVLAAGYPYFSERDLEPLRPAVTSGHVNTASPSLLQTSCCVQSGFSGGPIFRITQNNAVEVLGIIASSAKTQTGACYPNINMAVPVTAFAKLITNFLEEKDISKLSSIENNKEMIQSQWRLMPYRSKI